MKKPLEVRGRGKLVAAAPRCSLAQVRSRFTSSSVTMDCRWSQRFHPCCPTPPPSPTGARAGRHPGRRARPRVRDAARRLRRGDAPRAGAGLPGRRAGRARRLRDEGVPVGRDPAALRRRRARRRRLDGGRARVRPARRHPGRASRHPRQQQGGRAPDRRDGGRRVDRARLARRARPRAGVRCDAVPDPRHARGSKPTRTRR